MKNPHKRIKQALRRRTAARRAHRRGVLLLVVLSILVMFMLIGTAFILTTSQDVAASKAQEKSNIAAPQQADLLDRALRQLLRDTNNRDSAIRFHSLLRDVYGTDGFVGRVFAGAPNTPGNTYAGYNGVTAVGGFNAASGFAANATGGAGMTLGQFIDIYVQDDFGVDAATLAPIAASQVLSADFVIGLENNELGLPQNYTLSPTKGYYNGCLLTMLSGPAKGQSVRVLSYDYDPNTKIGRLRTMAPSRADGTGLTLPGDLVEQKSATEYFGHQFMVNGRPFNGAGVGLNLLADPTGARLTAYEAVRNAAGQAFDGSGELYGGPVALLPNARFFFDQYGGTYNLFRGNEVAGALLVQSYLDDALTPPSEPIPAGAPLYAGYSGPGGADESYDAPDFQNMFLASMPLQPRSRGRVVNPGDGASTEVDAYYGAVNALAPLRLDLEGLPIPSFHRPALVNFWLHRLYNAPWLSSYSEIDRIKAILLPYGPDGIAGNGDEGHSVPADILPQIVAFKRKYTLRPLLEDHPSFTGSNPFAKPNANQWAALGAINRFINGENITFPTMEVAGPWDVDNDNDGVPDSIWVDLGMPVKRTEDGRLYKPLFAILVQDLDNRLNLNAHGSSAHLARDIRPSENPSNAPLNDSTLDPTATAPLDGLNLADGVNALGTRFDANTGNDRWVSSSNILPTGSGWGPADVSLRPVLSPLFNQFFANAGNPLYDDYARLMFGRPANTANPIGAMATWGRYGNIGLMSAYYVSAPADLMVKPGVTSLRDQLLGIENFEYPTYTGDLYPQRYGTAATPSGFGTPPDLDSRYAVGLDYNGQPVRESAAPSESARWVLGDSPYELSLADGQRRGSPAASYEADLMAINSSSSAALGSPPVLAVDDDAPFSPAELEAVLRRFDTDASLLPDRLGELVDAFDPDKLVLSEVDPNPAQGGDANGAASPGELLTAQIEAATRSRAVTTDSFDIPSTNENWTARLVLGADGLPGVPGVNDDNDVYPSGHPQQGDPMIDEADEAILAPVVNQNAAAAMINAQADDYALIMVAPVPEQARLIDYLRYRIVLELKRKAPATYPALMPASHPALTQAVNNIIYGHNQLPTNQTRNGLYSFGGLLAPEVLAGLKMDLNRPFGDGKDNNGNGVVDEPLEAGESWIDSDGNGVWENEPFLESDGIIRPNGNPNFYADRDQDDLVLGDEADDWLVQGRDLNGDGNPDPEPIVDNLWHAQLGSPVAFDHTGSQDANGRGAFLDTNGDGRKQPNEPAIHDDAQMARQLYARHLYCLAMLTMDENYLMPYDVNDPQVVEYLDADGKPTARYQQAGSPAWQIAQSLAGDDDLDGNPAATPLQKAEAVRIALKKLTCRRIAQWAINCADMRDPDAIMTPFEYDENPWDGWNVVDTKHNQIFPIDGDVGTDENRSYIRVVSGSGGNFFLRDSTDLDGDNDSDETTLRVQTENIPPRMQTRGVVWGTERPELLITETFAFHDRRVEDLEFEDPSIELGQQDENGNPISNQNKTIGFVPTQQEEDDGIRADTTMDQRLRPEGGAFVELYNPWSKDGQLPAELYRGRDLNDEAYSPFYNDRTGTIDTPAGVDLALLSPVGVPAENDPDNIQYSPVWRMIAIEEHPRLRNDDIIDNATQNSVYDPSGIYEDFLPKSYEKFDEVSNPRMLQLARRREEAPAINRSRVPDPDFPTFNPDLQPTLLRNDALNKWTFDVPNPIAGAPSQTPISRFRFATPRRYVERAFYFTSNNDGTRDPENLKVRIPLGRIKIPTTHLNSQLVIALRRMERAELWADGIAIVTDNGRSQLEIFNHHFVPNAVELFEAATVEEPGDGLSINDVDLAIAPVLPGRYCVVGTAGYSYNVNQVSGRKKYPGRFITPLGRQSRFVGQQNDKNQIVARNALNDGFGTRRIELIPWPDPDCHQVMVDDNGGNESWLINFDTADNRHDRNLLRLFGVSINDDIVDGGGNIRPSRGKFSPGSAEQFIQPAVAIPIKGMSLSAPLDNYLLRRIELEPTVGQNNFAHKWEAKHAFGEGQFSNPAGRPGDMAPYDMPFDLPRELVENHTTPNYRTVHLQRLANPLLPWNPLPGEEFHNANLPVNPYLTVDGSSVDLTAFNGTDPKEASIGNRDARNAGARPEYPAQLHEWDAPLPGDGSLNVASEPLMTLSSNQRGLHAVNIALFGDPSQADPARLNFQQEPINILPELDFIRLSSRSKMSFQEHRDELNVIPELMPREHVVDFPFYHSLGFMNQPALRPTVISTRPNQTVPDFGLPTPDNGPNFYTQSDGQAYNNIDANGDTVLGDIVGSPKTDPTGTGQGSDRDDDTYAVLQWGNRPYASALELMQVPAASSGALTREFSTFNPQLGTMVYPIDPTIKKQYNPYNGSLSVAQVAPPAPANNIVHAERANTARYHAERAQFGHLLNFFNTNPAPAQVIPVTDGELEGTAEVGSANLHRVLSYLRVPSRFVGTQTTLNPSVFSNPASVSLQDDPRREHLAPFNRVDTYREPGRVNLNTVVGQRLEAAFDGGGVLIRTEDWAPVYDGLMHRYRDSHQATGGALVQLGHAGPAWRDVLISRRGYSRTNPNDRRLRDPRVDSSMMNLHPNVPTFFGNPFRESEEGHLVPVQSLVRSGAEATLLRSHPFTPRALNTADGTPATWGAPFQDDNQPDVLANGLRDDAHEAGAGDDDDLFVNVNADEARLRQTSPGLPENYVLYRDSNNDDVLDTPIGEKTRVPLFANHGTDPALNGQRNAELRYQPMTRLSSMTTTRSHVFAVWITVGFFEVTPADAWTDPGVPERFNNNRQLYDRVYPEGYQLGEELGSETGDTQRFRGFWIIDRSQPVAFLPGEDVNIERAILLRREIE